MNTDSLTERSENFDLRWKSAHGAQAKIKGERLLLAIAVAFAVMAVAIAFAVKLSAYSGYLWPGFLPLFVGWAGLYPFFKRLEESPE